MNVGMKWARLLKTGKNNWKERPTLNRGLIMSDGMMPGPCVVCGHTNYPLSMGGPTICPTCDCGGLNPRQVRALINENRLINDALARANALIGSQADENDKIVSELKRQIDTLKEVTRVSDVSGDNYRKLWLALFNAVNALRELPNVENRCGEWKDVNEAIKNLLSIK